MLGFTVAIGGFSSGVGKTTLMCELLRAFPGWEAIKMTRGHYRSCGKSAETCCVSHLLGNRPVIRSGHQETYTPGKDTGRYWDAGASNVHWVIVTDNQVEQGIKLALERVSAPGVLIEGNSFLRFVNVDFTVMVAPAAGARIKPSARRALQKSSALYLFENEAAQTTAREQFSSWLESSPERDALSALPVFAREDLPSLIARLQAIRASIAL